MKYFVKPGSIVREIWGKSNTVLLIFAGAAAEFALNKAVDWLYFTGRLPADPMGRLFSTVSYAQQIVFAEETSALRTIDAMNEIHKAVEIKRGAAIPDWAYRDVLYMLIDYSIRAFEMLERKLTMNEQNEIFQVFYKVGSQMNLKKLPESFPAWQKSRRLHLNENLQLSHLTDDLYAQYARHLGPIRYRALLLAQALIVPERVGKLLKLRSTSLLSLFVGGYQLARSVKADRLIKHLLIPASYQHQVRSLDYHPTNPKNYAESLYPVQKTAASRA